MERVSLLLTGRLYWTDEPEWPIDPTDWAKLQLEDQWWTNMI
jgi:hypothetical protein